jgi:hypothetical protein
MLSFKDSVNANIINNNNNNTNNNNNNGEDIVEKEKIFKWMNELCCAETRENALIELR